MSSVKLNKNITHLKNDIIILLRKDNNIIVKNVKFLMSDVFGF